MKVLLASPVYGQAPIQSIESIYATHRAGVVDAIKFGIGDSLVSRARNNLADFFLKDTRWDALFFVDSDLVFAPEHALQVIQHVEAGYPIVAGLYPVKQAAPLRWVANMIPGHQNPEKQRGLTRCKEAGTGFLCIHRRVFEALEKDLPENSYICDISRTRKHDFFRVGVCDVRYLSEDWFFCHDARESGFETWADTSVLIEHLGQVSFPIAEPTFSNL